MIMWIFCKWLRQIAFEPIRMHNIDNRKTKRFLKIKEKKQQIS